VPLLSLAILEEPGFGRESRNGGLDLVERHTEELGRMSQASIFDSEIALPNDALAKREKGLLGFDQRYVRVHDQLRLMLNVGALGDWNRKHHDGKLALCDLVPLDEVLVLPEGQYPIRARHIRYYDDRHFGPIDKARKGKALPTTRGSGADGRQIAVGKLSGLAASAERADAEVFGEAARVFQAIAKSAKSQRKLPARV